MGCSNCTHPKGVSPAECSVHIRDRPWSSATAGSTAHGGPLGGELRWQPEDQALLRLWLVSHEPPGWDPCLHHSLWLCPQGLLAQTPPGHLGLDCRCQDHTESRQPHNAHVSKDTERLSTHSGSKAAPEMVRVTRVTTCCGLHVCVPQIYTVRPEPPVGWHWEVGPGVTPSRWDECPRSRRHRERRLSLPREDSDKEAACKPAGGRGAL